MTRSSSAPDDGTAMMTKLEGGIGALTEHLREMFESHGGEIRCRTKVEQILVDDGRWSGVRCRDGEVVTAPVVVSNLSPDTTLTELIGADHLSAELTARLQGRDHRASFVQMHFALDGLPEFAPLYDLLNEPGMQPSVGIFGSPEEQQRQWENACRGIVPDNPSLGIQIPSVHDQSLAPTRKARRQRVRLRVPGRDAARSTRPSEKRDGATSDRQDQQVCPQLQGHPDPAHHLRAVPHEHMFGAPAGDFCDGLLHPDLMGPNRPGPKGFRDLPIGVDGLYLGSAGCHGGPGITFIPGYNAGHQVLDDLS